LFIKLDTTFIIFDIHYYFKY